MQPVTGPAQPSWWSPAEHHDINTTSTWPRLHYTYPTFAMYINAVYYPNWRVYRNQPPSSLNFGMISHVFYAFTRVAKDGRICLSDEWADAQMEVDETQGCLRSFRQLKSRPENAHLKVILSVGGGGEGSDNFPAMARDPELRNTFATSARYIVDEYNLDGIDIDWEHPSDPQQGSDFVDLLRALRAALPQPRYLLTSALPAGEWALKNINLAQAAQFLDLVNIMTYDFTGTWTPESGHHAQLFSPHHHHGNSCDKGLGYVIGQGVPPNKILLGIPIYGRSFLGCHSCGQAYCGVGGEEGAFEYKDLPRPGTTEQVDWDACAAYCVGGDGGFVTYDNPQTVQLKAGYAKSKGLAGLFYWQATADASGSRSLIYSGYSALHSVS